MRKTVALLGLVLLIGGGYFLLGRSPLPEPDLQYSSPIRRSLENGTPITVVAFGNSITAGVNASFSYLDVVGKALRKRYPNSQIHLINAGVPGDTAQRGLQRVDSDVVSHDPDLVFVEFGWNDLKNGVSEERFENNLRTIQEQIREANHALVYLMTTTQVDVVLANWKIRSRNRIIRRIAHENGCGLIDLFAFFQHARKQGIPLKELMSSDHIHPSEKGQDLIAQAILREILP